MQQPRSEEHLSADVLSAYAERALPAAEEREALEHLSACAECREILYLANAAMEEQLAEQVASVTPERARARGVSSSFRKWKWALPLAAVLLFAAVLLPPRIIRMKLAETPQEIAQAKREAPQAAEESNNSSIPASAKMVKSALANSSRTAKGIITPQPATPRRDSDFAKDKTTNVPAEPVVSAANSFASGLSPKETKTSPAADAVNDAVKKESGGAYAGALVRPEAATPAPPQNNNPNETINVSGAATTVDIPQPEREADEKVAQVAVNRRTYDNLQSITTADLRAKKAAPLLWRVTSNGTLEHLINGSWQTTLEDSKVEFLVVTHFKRDVWAAGKNLALYHSGDNGKHWERQSVPAEAPADIVQISFTSALNGTLKTSASGDFSTVDGGKTWVHNP